MTGKANMQPGRCVLLVNVQGLPTVPTRIRRADARRLYRAGEIGATNYCRATRTHFLYLKITPTRS